MKMYYYLDTLGVESSVEDTTASCNGGAGASGRGARHCVTSRAGADWREHAERVQRDARHGERRGRRVVARHAHSSPQQSTVRYILLTMLSFIKQFTKIKMARQWQAVSYMSTEAIFNTSIIKIGT